MENEKEEKKDIVPSGGDDLTKYSSGLIKRGLDLVQGFEEVPLYSQKINSNGAMFRANLQRTGVFNTRCVRSLKGLMWKFKTDGTVFSSPLVVDDLVFVGSHDGYLYAINRKSGLECWKFGPCRWIRSSPAVADGVIFFGCEDGRLYAVDIKSRNLKWYYQTNAYVSSSPVVANGVVFFISSDCHLFAINAVTGQLKWSTSIGDALTQRSSPALDSSNVFVGSSDGHLYAVDLETGRERWKYKTDSCIWSTPVVYEDSIYFLSQDNCLYTVNTVTGDLNWKYPLNGFAAEFSSPVVIDDLVLFLCRVTSPDLPTYTKTIDEGPPKFVVVSNYLDPNLRGQFTAVDVKTGKVVWCVAISQVGLSSPIYCEGMVYFGCGNSLYAVDVKERRVTWRFNAEDLVDSSPFISDGAIYFGSADGNLYALH